MPNPEGDQPTTLSVSVHAKTLGNNKVYGYRESVDESAKAMNILNKVYLCESVLLDDRK
jgi:hypothetical protein